MSRLEEIEMEVKAWIGIRDAPMDFLLSKYSRCLSTIFLSYI
jgi:hypothetical protein